MKASLSPPRRWVRNKVVTQRYACICSVVTTSPPHLEKTETIATHHTNLRAVRESTGNTFVIIISNRGGDVVTIREKTALSPPRPQVVTGGDNTKVVTKAKNTVVQRSMPKNKLILEGLA